MDNLNLGLGVSAYVPTSIPFSDLMDHSDLVEELPRIERMTAAERLRLAKERRTLQLRRYHQYNREHEREDTLAKKQVPKRPSQHKNGRRNVRFVESVMLLEAAARNDIDEVRRLLEKGVSPDSTNEDGLTALHQCCIDDSEEMMKLLVDYGANVNAEDSEKWTPLHAAATCGHLHLVNYLIQKSANLLAVNADGNMPYDICEDDPTLDLIESEMANRGVTQELIDVTRAAVERQMLLDLKALARDGRSLEERNTMGATPLHIAAANGYLSVVEFLLDQHVATDVRDADEWQPIHAAACWGHIDVLEWLVQNGADLNAQTKNHETPYDICEDGEMRARILALKTELESKRLAEAAHRGARRSASSSASNPRTQSIRRTSIRDKTLTPKKDARNEALMRLQMDHGSGIGNDLGSNGKLVKKHEPESEDKLAVALLPAPPRNKMIVSTADHHTQNSALYKVDNAVVPLPVPVPVSVDANSNGKIDIHVSVTFSAPPPQPALPPIAPPVRPPRLSLAPQSAVTLADLKKHRALNRFHSWDLSTEQSVANGHAHLVGQAVAAADNHQSSSHKSRPPSPTGTKPVFVGESFEVVGDTHKRQLCCVIF